MNGVASTALAIKIEVDEFLVLKISVRQTKYLIYAAC